MYVCVCVFVVDKLINLQNSYLSLIQLANEGEILVDIVMGLASHHMTDIAINFFPATYVTGVRRRACNLKDHTEVEVNNRGVEWATEEPDFAGLEICVLEFDRTIFSGCNDYKHFYSVLG